MSRNHKIRNLRVSIDTLPQTGCCGCGQCVKRCGENDRAASCLQQFWLDAASPLMMLLERDEEFQLPAEAIQMIQVSIILMGNASIHHSTERKRQHLNPQLVEESDFMEAASMLFGENFKTIATQCLEVAAALKKTLVETGFLPEPPPAKLGPRGWQTFDKRPRKRLAIQRQQSPWKGSA